MFLYSSKNNELHLDCYSNTFQNLVVLVLGIDSKKEKNKNIVLLKENSTFTYSRAKRDILLQQDSIKPV